MQELAYKRAKKEGRGLRGGGGEGIAEASKGYLDSNGGGSEETR